MKKQSFATSMEVRKAPREVFDAINNVRGWWSEVVEGITNKQGHVFYYHHQDMHRCTILIEQMVEDEKVVWRVLDNYFGFTNDPREWTGTRMVFEILTRGDLTSLRFTHEGLTEEHECFDICHDAWTNYITQSLHKLIVDGKGEPNTKTGNEFQEEIEKRL
jgi:hypothetical protein